MLNLKNKIAIVTGCGTQSDGWGNGRAIATQLAKQGAIVLGTDLNLDFARNTKKFILEQGYFCEVFKVNMIDKKQVDDFFKKILQKYKKIDILVNNVGGSEPGDPINMTFNTWHKQFNLNIDTAFLCIKKVLPVMKKYKSGSIINISSVAGLRYIGKPQVGYSAAKAALIQMTKTTAIINAEFNVRLNCVIPGLINTPLVKRLAKKYSNGNYEEFVKFRHSQVPMKKMGDAFDVANAVLFLASDESKYITGTEIVVDGGLTSVTP